MKALSSFLFVFFALSVFSTSVAEEKKGAQASADPEALELVDRLIEATGGEEALKKIETRVASGTLSMPAQGIEIKTKMVQKAPDLVYVEQSIPGLMESKQGFDGSAGWSEDSLLGFRPLEGAELEQLRRESNIQRELHLKEEYPTMKRLEDQQIGERKVNVVEATGKDGRTETWYFDAETGLLAKMDQTMNLGPQGELEVTMLFSDYKEIDGIQLPLTTEVKNPAFTATLKIDKVEHNKEVKDELFQPASEDAKDKGEDKDKGGES